MTNTQPSTTVTPTDERSDLLTMLADQREQFRVTVRGINEEQARLRTTASALTLGGLLRHVANTERHWVQVIHDRDETAATDMASLGNEYLIGDDQTVEGLLAEWDSIVADTEALVRSDQSLDEMIPLATAPWAPERDWWSVRRILFHVFREIAQHSGHADIIRETLDGQNSTYARAGIDQATVDGWMAG